jgi:hypothetical protein
MTQLITETVREGGCIVLGENSVLAKLTNGFTA